MTDDALFTDADRQEMRALGISEEEARRQIALFADPPPQTVLARPCGIRDGIVRLEPESHAELLDAWSRAAEAGRLTKFVPASGAASRMFQSLLAARAADPEAAPDVKRLLESLPRFAFREDLARALEARGTTLPAEVAVGKAARMLGALFDEDGLGYGSLLKGLIPFHRYDDASRTAFDEHLVEGIRSVRDGSGVVRLHFTVAEEFRDRFEARLATVRPSLEESNRVRLDVGFSIQEHATDTIAVDAANRPFRAANGKLVFRPGGHGALLRNLGALSGDVVFVKNIDNVQHGHHAETTYLWKRLIAGHLLLLERTTRELLSRIESGDASAVEAALTFVRDGLGVREAPAGDGRAFVLDRLNRPLRVCGVVRNQGEPGGGPFWVRAPGGGVSAQIVESSQVDLLDAAQRAIWESSSHFNPVDLVVSLRRADGSPHRLDDFVDPSTVFISKKSKDGRELKALERPGLWNGAMAGWNTVFVEVPPETFSPVKTVFDLLRPAHQPD